MLIVVLVRMAQLNNLKKNKNSEIGNTVWFTDLGELNLLIVVQF